MRMSLRCPQVCVTGRLERPLQCVVVMMLRLAARRIMLVPHEWTRCYSQGIVFVFAEYCREFHCSHHECQVLLFNALLVVFSVLLVHSQSIPPDSRTWLSRSTSKIGALDDDETPLRFTAPQTATTRGVMVSAIMGALDVAPTLHFVESGLKNQR